MDVRLSEMAWETSLLGKRIGRLEGVDVPGATSSAETLRLLEQHARAAGFSVITARVAANHFAAVWALEAAGFTTADVGVTFEYGLAKPVDALSPSIPSDVVLRPADLEHLPALREMVAGLFLNSYYYVSPLFSSAEADLLHREWITNCVQHGRADRVLVAEKSGRAVGFITCRSGRDRIGVIELVGVATAHVSHGIGRSLVQAALGCFQELGAAAVRVRTQVTNIAAVNLYAATGAHLVKVDTTFIKPLIGE